MLHGIYTNKYYIWYTQLWISFISCTALFILTTTAFVKIQERYDPVDNRPHKSIGEAVYHQFEYVIRIITAQGK